MAAPARAERLRQAARGFSEIVERLPNGIRTRNPATGQYSLSLIPGPAGWHLPGGVEIDTAWVNADPVADAPWQRKMVLATYHAYAFREATLSYSQGQLVQYRHPGTGESVAFQPQQIQWSNDLNQVQAIADPQNVTATITDDLLRFANAYGPGLHFEWETQTARLAKALIIDSLASLPAPQAFIIAGGNPYLKLPFIFQRSAGVDIYINGQLWQGRNRDEATTTGAVEFRSKATGETLWTFQPPVSIPTNAATDAPDQGATYFFRATAQNLFVEVRVPYAWLQTAVYPVRVDPTITPLVGASSDDAHERGNLTPDTTNSSLFAYSNSNSSFVYRVGLRFVTSGLDQGDTINSAKITVNVTSTSVDDPYLSMYAEDVDSGATFTTTNQDVWDRVVTTATVLWDATSIGTGANDSPDISSIIQEIVDRAGFSAGNAINIMLHGTTAVGKREMAFTSYDGSTSNCAQLTVDYTAGAATQNINANAISSAATVYQPAVSVGAVTISANAITSAATVYQPAVSATFNIAPDAIGSAETVYQPAVTPGAVNIDAGFVASGETVYQPAVTTGAVNIAPDFVGSTETVYQPAVSAGLVVQANRIDSAEVVYQPAVVPGAVTIAPDAISSATTVYQPAVSASGVILADRIGSAETVYQPTVTPGAVTIAADAIASGATVYQPAVSASYQITVDFIDSGETVYQPAVAVGAAVISPNFISSAGTVYQPAVGGGTLPVTPAARSYILEAETRAHIVASESRAYAVQAESRIVNVKG